MNPRTRGTPTKMALFSAASLITAAVSTASVALLLESTLFGSTLVAKWYRWPTLDGRFNVRSVHV